MAPNDDPTILDSRFGYIDSEFTEILSWNGDGYDDILDIYTISNTPDTTDNFGINYTLNHR